MLAAIAPSIIGATQNLLTGHNGHNGGHPISITGPYSRTETVATNGLLQRVQEELKISGSSYYKSDFTYDLDQSDSETETVKDLVFGTDQLDHVWTDTLDDRGQIDLHKFAFEGNETSATQLWSDDFDFDYLGRVTDLSRSIDTISGPVAAIWSGSSKPADKSVAYRYNVDGTRQSLERSESGSVLTSNVYDYTAAGRTKKIEHGTGTVNPTTNQLTGGNLLGSHEYGYDAVGRLIVQADTYEDGAGTELRDIDRVFAYDQAGQLLKVTETVDGGTPATRDYTDGRSSTSTAWNASSDNRLKQDDTYDYEYDLEGRMTKRTSRLSPSIGAYDTFHWDPAGRLITVKQYNTSSVLVATIEYGYGADGLMSGRRVTDGSSNVQSETGYIHEGLQRVAELDLTGTDPVITELYLHGAQPNEIVATDVDTGSGYTSVWGFTDALGSLTTVASKDGSDWDVVHNVTTEYGGNRDQFGDTAGNDHLTSAKVWAGHYIDPDTGLIEAKARWYDPVSGRFISQDPIGFSAGDANLYRYVANSPTIAIDPDGLQEYAVLGLPTMFPVADRTRQSIDSMREYRHKLHGYISAIEWLISSERKQRDKNWSRNNSGGKLRQESDARIASLQETLGNLKDVEHGYAEEIRAQYEADYRASHSARKISRHGIPGNDAASILDQRKIELERTLALEVLTAGLGSKLTTLKYADDVARFVPRRAPHEIADEIRTSGHPIAANRRTVAVGEDAAGNLHVGSSNGLDRGMREAADRLGVNQVPSRPGLHAEEELMEAINDLRRVGTSKRLPCGPGEHNCAQQLLDRGIEVTNPRG